MTVYADGWVQLGSHERLIDAYWLDGFPAATTPDETRRGRGPGKRVSPIYDYDDGGIGAIQWLNVTRDAAAILKSDGGWKTGGIFHLWVSTGAGTLPYEMPMPYPVRVEQGEPTGWIDQLDAATSAAEVALGLRRLSM